jgi:hypothetical protein
MYYYVLQDFVGDAHQLAEPNPDSASGKTWIAETELSGSAQNDDNAGAGQGVGEGHPMVLKRN